MVVTIGRWPGGNRKGNRGRREVFPLLEEHVHTLGRRVNGVDALRVCGKSLLTARLQRTNPGGDLCRLLALAWLTRRSGGQPWREATTRSDRI